MTDILIGYFSLNHTRMGPAQDLFGQLWKEYALSDSRYLTSDPFVLCMETVTAVGTPLQGICKYMLKDTPAVYLGTSLFHRRCLHNHSTLPAASTTNHRLCWPDVRPDTILCYKHV